MTGVYRATGEKLIYLRPPDVMMVAATLERASLAERVDDRFQHGEAVAVDSQNVTGLADGAAPDAPGPVDTNVVRLRRRSESGGLKEP